MEQNGKIVLDTLGTIKVGSVKMIDNICGLGVRKVASAIPWLMERGLIEYDYTALCPLGLKEVKFYKITESGEAMAEPMTDPKVDMLTILPFTISEGVDYTRYTATFMSNTRKKTYLVEVKEKYDIQTKSNQYEPIMCDCKAFEIHKSCKHMERLVQEIQKWNKIQTGWQ